MEEVWIDILGYEGLYQVSNYGKVKRIERYAHTGNGAKRFYKSQEIKTRVDKYGTLKINLNKDGIKTTYYVAKLVYKTFNPSFDEKDKSLIIWHKDLDQNNNCIDNLVAIKRTDFPLSPPRDVKPNKGDGNMKELDKISVENKITFLRIDYDNFLLLYQLIKAYIKVDKKSFPGITGEKVYKLIGIEQKFKNKHNEVVELQEKLNTTLKEYFDGDIRSICGYWGSTNYQINNYKIDTSFILELTIEDLFVLYYYAELFKEFKHKNILEFKQDHIVFTEIDNILKCIQDCILKRIPSEFTFL